MTTSAYLALVEPVLTIPELVTADLCKTLKIGRTLITYTPRADQPLSLEHMIEAFADKLPANDNEPEMQPEAQPETPQPAVAASKHNVPNAIVEKTQAMPGVQRILQREANFHSQFGHLLSQPANAPSPFKGYSQLKNKYTPSVPDRVLITTRPAWENWIAHHPLPQPKNDRAA
jgi:hypothetical protein